MPNPWGFYDIIGNGWQTCRDTVSYHRYDNASNNDDISLTQTPSQSGQYQCTFGDWGDTGGSSRDLTVNTPYSGFGFRLSFIVP